MNYSWGIFVILIIYRIYISASNTKKSYKNYKLLQLEGRHSDVLKLIEYIDTVDKYATYEIGRDKTQLLLQPALVTRFVNAASKVNVKITVIVEDYSKLLEKETRQTLRGNRNYSWTDYYDIDDINRYLKQMHHKHNFLSTIVVGGESYQGRRILGIRVFTNVPLPGKKPKPVVLIESGTHAREWMTTAATIYFINQLLTGQSADIINLRNSFDWHIFPVLNPDGYHYSLNTDRMWRKSRSLSKKSKCVGVDLNRNWNYQFGVFDSSQNPCDYQFYAGPNAFSEVETRSMASYITKLNNILAFISFHTPSHSIIVPYSDNEKRIENYTLLENIAKSANAYGGDHYKFGNSPILLGKISGTSMDWVYSVKKPPITFTIELRGDSFFAPSYEISEIGEEVTKMLTGVFVEAHKYGLYQLPLPYG